MKKRLTVIENCVVLRTILSAGVLAVLVFSGADAAACTDYRCAQAVEVAA